MIVTRILLRNHFPACKDSCVLNSPLTCSSLQHFLCHMPLRWLMFSTRYWFVVLQILCAFTCFSFFVSEMVMLLEWWSGTDCTLYTDPESYHKYGKENAIVILNHNFEIDFLCGWNFCERFGVLGVSYLVYKINFLGCGKKGKIS